MKRLLPVFVLLFTLASCDAVLAPQEGEAMKKDTRVFRARMEVKQYKDAAEQWQSLRGEWPTDWATLKKGGLDPWGNEYELVVEDDLATVFSYGPDGKRDTDDDVLSD